MFRNEYTAKVGFTRLLDRTCPKDGGLYASNEKSHCPKCQSPLVQPTRPGEPARNETGPIPYCFTEVTLYPLLRKEVKDKHAARTASAKGVLYVIRMTLWGRYDTERGVLEPDGRTQYLVPKRTIRVEFNNPPTLIPYTANDKSTKIEMKYVFDGRAGDQIEFLDAKQTATASMAGAEAVTPVNTALPNASVAVIQEQFGQLMKMMQAGGVLPAPNPADASMSMDEPEDYQPDNGTVAQEETLDPFSV